MELSDSSSDDYDSSEVDMVEWTRLKFQYGGDQQAHGDEVRRFVRGNMRYFTTGGVVDEEARARLIISTQVGVCAEKPQGWLKVD